MLFPWIVAGDPGRVAFVFYATTDTQRAGGFPGGVNALWHAYAVLSTNAMDASPTFTQVQVDEHVFHRSTICTGGFPGCLTGNADRSLADFFMVDKDPDGRVFIAYNENSDLSLVVPDPPEYIGKPINAIARIRTGPSLFAAKGNLLPDPAPANIAITSASVNAGTLSVSGTQGLPPGNWATDTAGDAVFPVVPAAGPNQPALDIREVSASDDGTNLTFKLKMADLSPTALAQAAPLVPSWMVMWWQGKGGLGPVAMTSGPFHSHWFVRWLGSSAFEYGRVSSIDFPSLGAPNPQFLSYPVSGTATGSVVGNEVTISVPLASLMGLAPGDKIDNVTAYGLGAQSTGAIPVPFVVDQAKSFSYVIGTPPASQHLSDGYVEVSLDGFATSTSASLNNVNNTWTASIAGAPTAGTVCARQVLAKDLYTPVWDDVQAGPASCVNFSGLTATGAVSRKTHGTAGVFDVNLPLIGTHGIECRTGGASGNHQVVVTFAVPVTVTNATVTPGAGGTGSVVGAPAVSGNQVTVNLTNVSNAQTLTVNLLGVNDGTNTGNVVAPMAVLLGDTSANGLVNSTDVSQTQSQSGQPVTGSNFRTDVTVNGLINSTDVSTVQSKSGTGLP
jgi:hypothetical protein